MKPRAVRTGAAAAAGANATPVPTPATPYNAALPGFSRVQAYARDAYELKGGILTIIWMEFVVFMRDDFAVPRC